ncbi:MAG: YceI family protein [Chitinophagaceae bacterium]
MKRILYLALALVLSVNVLAQNLVPAGESSSVNFKIKNLGFNVSGSFSGLKGKIRFEPSNAAASSFDVTVDANTVNTDNNSRDNHLRKEDYFNVEKYPTIRFVSTKVSGSGGNYTMTGKLTMKDVTKDVSFPFTAKEEQGGYLFDGEFKIKRKDFHVGGGSTISDELTVTLHVLGKKE